MPISSLLLILAAVVALAACVELVNFIAREFLVGLFREETLKVSIRRAEKDLVETRRKIDTLVASLRSANEEFARAHHGAAEIETTIAQRGILDPVLVLSETTPHSSQLRFRAPISKTLREGAAPQQAQVWGHSCFVEVPASSAQAALADARAQYPRERGYVIGAFVAAPRKPARNPEEAAA